MDKSGSRDNGWAKFEEYAKQREVVGGTSGLPGSRNPLSPTAGRLHKEDMAIYGREPATDNMILVVCELCGRVVKSQALLKHRELYHTDAIRSPPPPRRPPDHLLGGAGPIQTIGQSTSLGSTTTGGSTKKSRECDLDRHCGVWIESDKRLCRKSITCKNHSLELRQKVTGRSKPFAELLHEYKKLKKIKKLEKLRQVNPFSSAPPPPLITSPATPTNIATSSPVGSSTSPAPVPPLPVSSIGAPTSPLPSSLLVYLDESDNDEYCNSDASATQRRHSLPSTSDHTGGSVVSETQLYPKPAAVNRFGSHHMSQGYFTFSRRSDPLRYSLVSLSEREKEFIHTPDSTILRQCNHLSQQRHVVKKYSQIGSQNHILLSYTGRHNPPSPSSTSITLDHISAIDMPTLDKWNHIQGSNGLSTDASYALTPPPTRSRKRSRTSSSVIVSNRMPPVVSTSHIVNMHSGVLESMDNDDIDDEFHKVKRHNVVKIKREEDDTSSYNSIEQQQYLTKLGYTPPLTMNGLAGSPVQPFPVTAGGPSTSSSSSQSAFVINPSHSVLPRSILPITGFGVSHQVPNPSTQSAFSPVMGGERRGSMSLFPTSAEHHHHQQVPPGGTLPQVHQLWINNQQQQQIMNYEANSYHHHPHHPPPPHSHSPHPHSHSPHPSSPHRSVIENHTSEHVTEFHSSSLSHMNKFGLPNAPVPPSPLAAVQQQCQTVPGPLPPPLNPVGGTGGGVAINSTSPPRLHRLPPSGGGGGGGSQTHHSYRQSGLVASQNVTQRTQQVS